MDSGRIGVDIDDFRLATREALAHAARLDFRTIEMSMACGELAPHNLSHSGRRHLSRHIRGLGLDFAAIVGDMPPGLRLADPATNSEVVDRTRGLLALAADMRVPIVTAGVLALSHHETGDPSPHAVDALRQIAVDADSTGTIYALRPSADSAERLIRVINEVGCPSIRICLDPAAMVMAGNDPAAVMRQAGDQIVLSHARDATAGSPESAGVEMPLGEGEVDLPGYMAMLDASDYHGPLIIRRRNSPRPVADIIKARKFLEDNMPRP